LLRVVIDIFFCWSTVHSREIPEIAELSWSCPEIWNCPEISVI